MRAGCETSPGVDIDTAAKSVRKHSGFATLHTHPCEEKTGCQPDEGNLKAKLSNAALCYVVTEGEKVQLKLNNHLKRMWDFTVFLYNTLYTHSLVVWCVIHVTLAELTVGTEPYYTICGATFRASYIWTSIPFSRASLTIYYLRFLRLLWRWRLYWRWRLLWILDTPTSFFSCPLHFTGCPVVFVAVVNLLI